MGRYWTREEIAAAGQAVGKVYTTISSLPYWQYSLISKQAGLAPMQLDVLLCKMHKAAELTADMITDIDDGRAVLPRTTDTAAVIGRLRAAAISSDAFPRI